MKSYIEWKSLGTRAQFSFTPKISVFFFLDTILRDKMEEKSDCDSVV